MNSVAACRIWDANTRKAWYWLRSVQRASHVFEPAGDAPTDRAILQSIAESRSPYEVTRPQTPIHRLLVGSQSLPESAPVLTASHHRALIPDWVYLPVWHGANPNRQPNDAIPPASLKPHCLLFPCSSSPILLFFSSSLVLVFIFSSSSRSLSPPYSGYCQHVAQQENHSQLRRPVAVCP